MRNRQLSLLVKHYWQFVNQPSFFEFWPSISPSCLVASSMNFMITRNRHQALLFMSHHCWNIIHHYLPSLAVIKQKIHHYLPLATTLNGHPSLRCFLILSHWSSLSMFFSQKWSSNRPTNYWPSLIITKHHQPSPCISNYHLPSSAITDRHQRSLTITNHH